MRPLPLPEQLPSNSFVYVDNNINKVEIVLSIHPSHPVPYHTAHALPLIP